MRRSPRNTPPVVRQGVPNVVEGEQQSVSGLVQASISQQSVDLNKSGPSANSGSLSNDPRTPANPSPSPIFFNVTEDVFRNLLSGLAVRLEIRTSTFSTCTARFSGERNSFKVEDFIATILVYKE